MLYVFRLFNAVFAIVFVLFFAGMGAYAQTSHPHQGGKVSPRQKAIQDLFQASRKSWPSEKRIRLEYTFDSSSNKLVEDFVPRITSENKRIRFPTPGDRRHRGLILAEYGQFLHRAVWKQVKVDMKFTSYSVSKKGDLVAAVLSYDRDRWGLACNMGKSMQRIRKGKPYGRPAPLVYPQAARRSMMRFGFEFGDGLFRCRYNGKAATDAAQNPIDTAKFPKWLKKADEVHVGVIWRGQTQGFLEQIIIEGELDESWLAKQLPKISPGG